MKYCMFGNIGLFVFELCMGVMIFGGKGVFEVIGVLG